MSTSPGSVTTNVDDATIGHTLPGADSYGVRGHPVPLGITLGPAIGGPRRVVALDLADNRARHSAIEWHNSVLDNDVDRKYVDVRLIKPYGCHVNIELGADGVNAPAPKSANVRRRRPRSRLQLRQQFRERPEFRHSVGLRCLHTALSQTTRPDAGWPRRRSFRTLPLGRPAISDHATAVPRRLPQALPKGPRLDCHCSSPSLWRRAQLD